MNIPLFCYCTFSFLVGLGVGAYIAIKTHYD